MNRLHIVQIHLLSSPLRILIKFNFKDVISDYLKFEQICSLLLSSCVWIYWECNWILSTQFGISNYHIVTCEEDKTKCDVCMFTCGTEAGGSFRKFCSLLWAPGFTPQLEEYTLSISGVLPSNNSFAQFKNLKTNYYLTLCPHNNVLGIHSLFWGPVLNTNKNLLLEVLLLIAWSPWFSWSLLFCVLLLLVMFFKKGFKSTGITIPLVMSPQ